MAVLNLRFTTGAAARSWRCDRNRMNFRAGGAAYPEMHHSMGPGRFPKSGALCHSRAVAPWNTTARSHIEIYPLVL